jgi:hypothetical protein
MIGPRALRFAVLALLAAMLWSCGATGSPWYEAPPGLTGATGATVSMSDNPAAAGGPDGDTRVVTVDGQPVSAMEWDRVVLTPGQHTLGVQYNGASAASTVPIRAMLRTGASYAVKGQKDGPCDAVLWLEDRSTNQALGDRLETHLTAKPMMSGAPVFAVACN